MGRRNKNNGPNLKPGICQGATLREENSGKKDADVSSILKIKHLQKLAVWAGGEGGIPPLGAFYGYQLAANAEALGVPLDSSFFFCQRCESVLQPGFNCTIRIEKCKNKKRKRSKKKLSFQNNVIYNCNFCHYRNSIKGTIKGQMKYLMSSRESTRSKFASGSKCQPSFEGEASAEKVQTDVQNSVAQTSSFSGKENDSTTVRDLSDQKTPLQNSAILSKNKRKASELKAKNLQFSCSGAELSGSGKGSSRRKRKAWSSLKDIVERKDAESGQSISKLVIPFFL